MLQFSELNQVFPRWEQTTSMSASRSCPLRELEHITKIFVGIYGIKEGTKFRVIKGKLEIDNRNFQGFRRKLSGDSRWKVLQIIKELVDKYSIHTDILKVVKVLYNGAYKNDNKWKESLHSIIPIRYFQTNTVTSPMSSGQITINEPSRLVVLEGTGAIHCIKFEKLDKNEKISQKMEEVSDSYAEAPPAY